MRRNVVARARTLAFACLPYARSFHVRSMPSAELTFGAPTPSSEKTVIVGRKTALLSAATKALLPDGCGQRLWEALVQSVETGDEGGTATSLYTPSDAAAKPGAVVAAVLPEPCSRHASPLRPHAVTALVGAGVGASADASVVAVLDDPTHAGGVACAVARAFPRYSFRKPPAEPKPAPAVRVGFATAAAGAIADKGVYSACTAAAAGVRLAARIVDTPPAELTTLAFEAEAREAAARLSALGREVQCSSIAGDALREQGYGFIHAVGRAAECPPALVILSHVPTGAERHTVLVGKGIVYDTGGLALKGRDGMCGMKADCGGAAALLGAFESAVAIGTRGSALHLILCLAENAIGPTAVRNDDVIQCFSGKTCEVNNSDAEGRLVLSDGVAHATALPPRLPGLARHPHLVVDMATLTGAQGVATGKRHGAIVSNFEDVEVAAVAAGKISGDLVHPLPYAPEFYRKEFKSKVADMKNSVKDRSNAQSSCAGNFIAEHLHPEYKGGWLHVDMAGPAFIDDRATGYGVGLILGLLGVDGFRATDRTDGPPAKKPRA